MFTSFNKENKPSLKRVWFVLVLNCSTLGFVGRNFVVSVDLDEWEMRRQANVIKRILLSRGSIRPEVVVRSVMVPIASLKDKGD